MILSLNCWWFTVIEMMDALIEALARAETAPDAFNQFAADDNPYNALRRANLRRYLADMLDHQPAVALIMEAPGYRGMRLTGVPVTSRKVLLDDAGWFGKKCGYRDVPEPGFERVTGEQSATIMWGTLAALNVRPLIWNAFPFHPHIAGEALTNRAPRRPEVEQGRAFLRAMLDLFQPATVIAVGNVADASLTVLGVPHQKVRHPAQGGKNDFVAGLTALLS
jgi:uracil-DNA glycosylase